MNGHSVLKEMAVVLRVGALYNSEVKNEMNNKRL